MAPRVRRPRLVLIAGVSALAVINALALWGDEVAERGEAVLQVATALGAAVCGMWAARRVRGLARWWRLLFVGALLTWAFGQVLWAAWDLEAAPVVNRVSFLLMPVLAMGSLVLLLRSSGPVTWPTESPLRHPLVANVLDGIVAGLSFLALAVLGDFGTTAMDPGPEPDVPILNVVFAFAELVVVAVVVGIIMIWEPGRPYRQNFLLLATGLLIMATCDRLVAYFRSVGGAEIGTYGAIGLIIGPLFIAFAMLEQPPPRPSDAEQRNHGFGWGQLILPYVGFVGITLLLAYHVWIGQEISPYISAMIITTVVLITVRQVLATRALSALTQRLFWAQRKLAYQVHHDALTGLPNRLMFAERLDQAMGEGPFVLIFIDLDDFKDVNDRFGHAAGDELLCAVGDRLKRYVREGDTLARIGGDEYAILITDDVGNPGAVADRLRMALREPFAVHGVSVRVRASMGLVQSATGGPSQTSDDLLRQADISMYAGKRLGKNSAVVYQPSAAMKADFPTALRAAAGGVPDGFRLVYQPVVSLVDGSITALEALARWTAPNGMEVSPETFVAAAEAAGLGARFDEMVLNLACREIMTASLDVDIHINVGAARLGNPGFESDVRRVLDRYRLIPRRLVLEITETLPIVDLGDAAAQIERFRTAGVRFALDDFGAGYNSLTYLHALPVHIVKLDRSLAVGSDPERDLTLYRSAIRLCTELSLDVIAEGIETEEQAETIVAAQCRFAQGYLFGRPASLEHIESQWAGRAPAVQVLGGPGRPV
ncbi:putative bifunctional diguanylate cyclase/phosphodiesterase [Mycobacterium sp. SMC-4]|uniref:putative bifunctional diguanylate cyclase/phosphodiesterase n=1 Tax=Mycobacterium sp. SMC-4 TaxID=2857059 RepID=UPI003CFCF819